MFENKIFKNNQELGEALLECRLYALRSYYAVNYEIYHIDRKRAHYNGLSVNQVKNCLIYDEGRLMGQVEAYDVALLQIVGGQRLFDEQIGQAKEAENDLKDNNITDQAKILLTAHIKEQKNDKL